MYTYADVETAMVHKYMNMVVDSVDPDHPEADDMKSILAEYNEVYGRYEGKLNNKESIDSYVEEMGPILEKLRGVRRRLEIQVYRAPGLQDPS